MHLCIAVSTAGAAAAQVAEIPGRDLLAFPLGLTAEAAALGAQAAHGLWNPATATLPGGARWRVGAAAMSAPTDLAISAQVASAAVLWRSTTFGLSIARASVSGLSRTDSDPQVIGEGIAYSTHVVSALAARRVAPGVVAGLALRARTGRLDYDTRTGLAVDAGFVAEHLTSLDLRVGASTFLLSPGTSPRDRASLLAAADARIVGVDSTRTLRAGLSWHRMPADATEHFLFSSASWGPWAARGGAVRTSIYGSTNWRARVGVAVRHAGYAVAVAREESVNGLAPTYQFSLTALR